MKKVLALAIFLSLNSSLALAWGHSYLKPYQNQKNYLNCLNVSKYGSINQRVIAERVCGGYYGVDILNLQDRKKYGFRFFINQICLFYSKLFSLSKTQSYF